MDQEDQGSSALPPSDDPASLDRRVVRRIRPAGAESATPEPAPARRRTAEPAAPRPVPWRRPDGDAAPDGAPHRLRDLGPTARIVALALIALLALPFVVGLVRLDRQGWMLNSDDALLGVRSLDVLGGDPPLIGQPSTSETAGGGVRTYHPGPIEMWAFAPLVRVLGGWGMVIGASLVNLAAVLTAVFVAYRRTGPAGGLVAAGLAAVLLRSVGTYVLADPVSSNLWGLGFVAVAALVWAVLDGDHRLLPLLALWASWAAQQHLAALAPTAWLVVVAVLAVVVRLVLPRDRPRDLVPLRWLGAAAAVGLVLWAPVLVQQVTGEEGNLTAIVTYAGVEGRTTQGLDGAFDIAVRSIEPVPVLLRTDVLGNDLASDPGRLATIAVGLVLLIAVAVVVAPGLSRRARLLTATGLALLPAGLFNASNIPDTVELFRINLHRWVWPFSTLVVVGLVWAAADLALRRAGADGPVVAARTRAADLLAGRGAVAATSLIAVIVLVAAVPVGPDDRPRDPYSTQVTRAVLDAVRDDMGDADRVLLIPGGAAAELSVVPAMTFALEHDGVAVDVPRRLEPYFGDRATDGDWDAAYVVTASEYDIPSSPGQPVADLLVDGRMEATVAALSDQLRGVSAAVNSIGELELAELTPLQLLGVRLTVREMGDDPVKALLDPRVTQLLAVGGIDGVSVDPEVLDRHRLLQHEDRRVWLSRRVVVLRVELGEVDAILERQEAGVR
ncbi:MAG TPA: hypothetical protein VK507_13960 [Iamia sp.]|nr:hypothetical protein [Iamia sp.]